MTSSSIMRRGSETKLVFFLAHTALIAREGRKLPATVAEAEKTFAENKKAKLVRHVDGERVLYTFEVGTDMYELYTQRG